MNQDSFVPNHSGGSEILRRFGKSSGQLLAVIRDRNEDLAGHDASCRASDSSTEESPTSCGPC